MSIFNDNNGNPLPQEVQDRVNTFIDNLQKVPWFKPSKELKKEEVEKQAKFTLECFWVKASIKYRILTSEKDWDSARDSARDSAWDSAWASARDSAWASAWDSARDSAWASAWDSARDSAWNSALASARASAWASARASAEILCIDNEDFRKKYPNWAFIQLFKLWEMWLYPVGILKDTKTFVIYIPPCSMDFPEEFK